MKHVALDPFVIPSCLVIEQDKLRRTYTLEGPDRAPIYQAQVAIQAQAAPITVTAAQDGAPIISLTPNRKVMNDGFKVIHQAERRVVGYLNRGVSWELSDARGRTIAGLRDITGKSDRFGCTLGPSSLVPQSYAIVARGKTFAVATPGKFGKQSDTNLLPRTIRYLFGSASNAAQTVIMLTYEGFADIAPEQLMTLMIAQREFG